MNSRLVIIHCTLWVKLGANYGFIVGLNVITVHESLTVRQEQVGATEAHLVSAYEKVRVLVSEYLPRLLGPEEHNNRMPGKASISGNAPILSFFPSLHTLG